MAAQNLIRVLIADDSQVVQALLATIVNAEPDMIVVGTASTGRETAEQLERLRPDLVTVDVTMPDGDGITATRRIMGTRPTPIVVITAAPVSPSSNVTFEALAAGAVQVLPKPSRSVLSSPLERANFVRELRIAARVGVVGIRQPAAARSSDHLSAKPSDPAGLYELVPSTAALIAIGASTGGPPCVRTVLQGLDAATAPPIAVVQHMSREFLPGFATWLRDSLPLPVCLVERRLVPERGNVYIAPGDRHLVVEPSGALGLSDAPAQYHQRPAVDVLLRSVADVHGARAIGVVLTGMGEDGADGLLRMRKAGAATIAQDADSCVVYGMPRAAVERDAASLTANPLAIGRLLRRVRARVSRPPESEQRP